MDKDAPEKLADVIEEKEEAFNPWTPDGWLDVKNVNDLVRKDPKYFKHVKINARAAAKMLEHAKHGVEKGRKRSGMPIEICGLLVGKIRKETFVVFDTLPLPVEGTEAQVVADSAAVLAFPFKVLPYIEQQGYSFIGWYHSHPFDVGKHPHWFMSDIDCQSQTMFQTFYKNAWCAIVLDPIRSLHRKTLELGSFYCFPAAYTPPSGAPGPDGLNFDKVATLDRWGNAYKRYYVLETDYFMSNSVKNNLRHVFDDWKQCFQPELRRVKNSEKYDVAKLQTLSANLEEQPKSYRSKVDPNLLKVKRLNHQISQYECRCRGFAQLIKHQIFNFQGKCMDIKS